MKVQATKIKEIKKVLSEAGRPDLVKIMAEPVNPAILDNIKNACNRFYTVFNKGAYQFKAIAKKIERDYYDKNDLTSALRSATSEIENRAKELKEYLSKKLGEHI